MRIAICDDCFKDACSMQAFLTEQEVKIYTDTRTLLEDIEEDNIQYDLYLLDIYIDFNMNGIGLAERIRVNDDEATICFVSVSEEFYREAYDVYAMQYLVKPVQKEPLEQLIEKVQKNIAKQKEQRFSFKYRGWVGSIPYRNILYISSRGHNIFIYCIDGTVKECIGKLNDIASQVSETIFRRSHQSFLVNMYHVDHLKGKELTVAGHKIPVSRRYYVEVKNWYYEILFDKSDV